MTGRAEDLPLGTSFLTVRGRRHGRVVNLLGAGGQGAVYTVDIEGARFALKWYHDSIVQVDRTLRARLSRAIGVGPPTDRFLWPIDLVEVSNSPSFGYVMPLRQGEYAGMRGLIARPPNRLDLSLARRVLVCHSVAHNFLELHARGFCYQDINFGNIFLNPNTGDVVICDNDNVDIDGMDASVFGTRKFMAPEVVMRRALPSTKTDLFSMGVAQLVTDPKIARKALDRPGEVIRLKRSGGGEEVPAPKRRRKAMRPPSRARLAAAEDSLAKLEAKQKEERNRIERDLDRLERKRDQLTARHSKARATAELKVERAREAYDAALADWDA